MRTLLLDPPAEVAAWLEQRRAKGQDLFDEVWEGTYHVALAPHPSHGDLDRQVSALLHAQALAAGLRASGPLNIGTSDDYRVPDGAYLRERAIRTFVDRAAIIVEIVSPRDETVAKIDFYFARGVEELLLVDPFLRTVVWLRRGPDGFESTDRSVLLGMSSTDLHALLDWPPTG